ncbi:MAG: RNA polymerase sigma factor [Solirubrobacteraceae bacterium]
MAVLAAQVRPSDQDTDDLALVAGIRAGDDRAFEVLYERYQPRITRYIRGMVQDDGRAEDITQEVFLSALRRMRETDRQIVFKPWIFEIAKNACIDAFRRTRHTNEISFDAQDRLSAGDHGWLADVGASPDIAVDTKLDLDNLRGAFGCLSDTHHQILVMRELEGLSYRDIGERLGMSRPAVESTLFRARRRLEEEYGEIVSGQRCTRVRAIIDAGGRTPGLRDQQRLDRHMSHCQPCRRHALMAGIDLEARPARRSVAARIAALLPLPGLWRRPGSEEAPVQMLGSPGQATMAHWSASVASTMDPGALAGWGKAVVAAATVAFAGVGAGAAITERDAVRDFFSRPPAVAGSGDSGARGERGRALRRDDGSSPVRNSRDGHRGDAARASGPAAAGGESGSGSSTGPREPAPATDAPASSPKPHPAGPEGSAGSSGGGGGGAGGAGGVGAIVDDTLSGTPGAGGDSPTSDTGSTSGVTSTADGVAGQVDGAVSGLTGAPDATGSGSAGPVQGVATPVTSAVGATLSGN